MLKNKNHAKTNGTATPQKSPSLNMISEGTKIKGTISTQNDIRIAGKLDGEAICKGKIIVTSAAHLDGDITSVDADIAGNVSGTVKVSEKLILRQSANIGGDIYTKLLVVEEGAQVNGTFRMGSGEDVLDGISDAAFAEATHQKEKRE